MRTTLLRSRASSSFEESQRLALVFVERIALSVAAQSYVLAQMFKLDDVLAPI
jgi:hypothetical protein